jgi:uncharacterized phage infection (PIP) family protein YhgE
MSSDKQLGNIDTKLIALKKQFNREAFLTASVGTLLIALCCGYFWYGYVQIGELLQPQRLVDYATVMAQDKLPDIRQQFEEVVQKNSPIWAAEISRQAVASVPTVREQLEDFMVRQSDDLMARTFEFTQPELEKFLNDNQDSIQRIITELKSDNAATKESIAELQKGLEQALQVKLQSQAEQAVRTLDEMSAKAEFLRAGNGLSDMDQKLKETISILRRLHLRELSSRT